MHEMYKALQNPIVSYEFYRGIFNTKFNISFGYPRSDTCSECDKFLAEMKSLKLSLEHLPVGTEVSRQEIEAHIGKLHIANSVHKAKAETFYDRKRSARKKAMKTVEMEAIALDYQKNLNLPNITTNDAYYKRQLTFISFNIHVMSTNQPIFYCYPETVGGKGSNEVVSFLHNFIFLCLNENVGHLAIFCDSCGGQNKNFTMFRFLHYVVHIAKRLSSITVTFPMRGHSYLECDRDMALVCQKTKAEVPQDWITEIRTCRTKPTPFQVIEVDQPMIRDWSTLLDCYYKKKCPFASRPIREFKISEDHPRIVEHRSSYNGHWESSVIREPIKDLTEVYPKGQFELPQKLYNALLPISDAKFKDLQHLKTFCGPKAKTYFENLPVAEVTNQKKKRRIL
ncbi:uncharacterized protein [Diabrotica undecimpunctata]|uniref:uncharacterized protein n=1 Tax=Diabrotica undecimpunctata TaxID=50387 RepID=UPI003B6425D8